MQSASQVNVRDGLVGHEEVSDTVRDRGVTVTEANIGATRVVTEKSWKRDCGTVCRPSGSSNNSRAALDITIGEALEATALCAGYKPVDQSDAAAAEVRAVGSNETIPGGVAAQAQSAADLNPRIMRPENKTTLSDLLEDATAKLPLDKPVTGEDAEGVVAAEIRNKPHMRTTPGGVAASVAAAARPNQNP